MELEDWLADLEIQFVELEEEMSTTGPSIDGFWKLFHQVDAAFLTQPNVTSNLLRVWAFCESGLRPAETERETKTSQRKFTSKTRHVHSFPTWPLSLSLTNGPGPREGHHSRRKPDWRMDQKEWQSWSNLWVIPWRVLRVPPEQELWPQKNLSSDPCSFCFFLGQELFRCYFTWFLTDLGEAPHGTWRSQLGPELNACQSLNRDSFPWILLLPHFAIVDTEESFPRVMAQRKEKSLSERPFFRMSMTIVVRGGTTAWWFSF